MLPEFTNDELSTISDFHKQYDNGSPEGQAVALDPSNEQHKKLILAALKASGQTKDKYPHLYSQIENSGSPSTGEPDDMTIVCGGTKSDGKTTATIWAANDKGTLYSGSNLMVLDGKENQLLAHGTNTDVHSGFMTNHTCAQNAKAAGKSVRIVGVNHMVGHDGAVRFTAVAGSRSVDLGSSPTITAPVKMPAHAANNYILVAVGRDASHQNADADYWYIESGNDTDPNLIVPFVGSIELPYPINGTAGQPVPNLTCTTKIYVDYGDSGAATVKLDSTYTTPTDVANGITMDASNNNKLNWSFPSDHSGKKDTMSLVYGTGPANHKLSAFYFRFSIPVTGSISPYYTFCVFSNGDPKGKANQCDPISNIQFWWCCLAKGTQVTMADGNQKDIESLDNTHRVRSGSHGADLGVEATTLGHHAASAGQTGLQGVYRLRTEDGKELIATGAHPIMTPNGAMMACHLEAGDSVLVSEGVSAVASCEAIDYAGMFYDLKLGNAEDRAKIGQNPVCSFHANGILVGDHAAMLAQADRQRYDLDFILPRIGSEFRTDYTNAVQDRNS